MKTITLKKSNFVIISAILVVAIGIGAFFVFFNKPATEISNMQTPLGSLGLMLDENMKPYKGRDLEDRGGEKTGTKIPGYGTVRLPSDKTDVKMILLNPEGNSCYFKFELVVEGETYFTSKLVEPSMCIEDITLEKPLVTGTYTAILKINAYSLDDNLTQMNGANVEFELIVI